MQLNKKNHKHRRDGEMNMTDILIDFKIHD